jgi:hypothetical protein
MNSNVIIVYKIIKVLNNFRNAKCCLELSEDRRNTDRKLSYEMLVHSSTPAAVQWRRGPWGERRDPTWKKKRERNKVIWDEHTRGDQMFFEEGRHAITG